MTCGRLPAGLRSVAKGQLYRGICHESLSLPPTTLFMCERQQPEATSNATSNANSHAMHKGYFERNHSEKGKQGRKNFLLLFRLCFAEKKKFWGTLNIF